MMIIIHNNKIVDRRDVHINIEDRGYQFGDGVYEVIRIYNGKFFALDEHLIRLERSLRELRINYPLEKDLLIANMEQLVQAEEIRDGILYLQITRGSSPRIHHFPTDLSPNMVAYVSSYPRPLTTIQNGAKAIFVEDIRWLRCDIKSINLLGNVLAKQAAKESGALEAIQHRGEIVTEGSSTNVFIVKEKTLFTHPANHLILNGITRNVVINLARKNQIPVIEQEFTKEDLLAAEEVFITSTTAEITPIIQVSDHLIGHGSPGPVTKQLQSHFELEIEKLIAQ
jgi:D-alanine transaminase